MKVKGGSPAAGVRWDVRFGTTAKVVLDAVSAGPEDTFTVVFDGERALGQVMLIDGEWDWLLRGVASGREPTRAKALRGPGRGVWGAKGGQTMTEPLVLERAPIGDNQENYNVLGVVVGRICLVDVGERAQRADQPRPPTREAAMSAFAKSWRWQR